MHSDTQQLAAYLDGALSDAERAELRAHVLTCATCAARLERMRDDGRRITIALSSSAAPDVRAAVRGRLRGSIARDWLMRGLALVGALASRGGLYRITRIGYNNGLTRPSPWPDALPQIPGIGLRQSGHKPSLCMRFFFTWKPNRSMSVALQ